MSWHNSVGILWLPTEYAYYNKFAWIHPWSGGNGKCLCFWACAKSCHCFRTIGMNCIRLRTRSTTNTNTNTNAHSSSVAHSFVHSSNNSSKSKTLQNKWTGKRFSKAINLLLELLVPARIVRVFITGKQMVVPVRVERLCIIVNGTKDKWYSIRKILYAMAWHGPC